MDYKAEFLSVYRENIHREGADAFLAWLEGTDFFTAPASTRYHGACEYGLVMHSLNVYRVMRSKFFKEGDDPESAAVVCLLHDVCKANFYSVSSRNVKNEKTGTWEKMPYYTIADSFPYGHGEKSVLLIEHNGLRLTDEEAVAIRWHMGGFDDSARGGSFAISEAYDRYPLAVKLHMADLAATYLLEKGTSSVNHR